MLKWQSPRLANFRIARNAEATRLRWTLSDAVPPRWLHSNDRHANGPRAANTQRGVNLRNFCDIPPRNREMGIVPAISQVLTSVSFQHQWIWHKHMKAIVYQEFGLPEMLLKCQEIEKPLQGDDAGLDKDSRGFRQSTGLEINEGRSELVRPVTRARQTKIKRPGMDVAGEVEAVGKNVTRFKPGNKVFGTCVGAFAEYATSTSARGMKSALVLKPDNVTFEQAAAAPVAALTVLPQSTVGEWSSTSSGKSISPRFGPELEIDNSEFGCNILQPRYLC